MAATKEHVDSLIAAYDTIADAGVKYFVIGSMEWKDVRERMNNLDRSESWAQDRLAACMADNERLSATIEAAGKAIAELRASRMDCQNARGLESPEWMLREQAGAWFSVCRVLDEVAPGWDKADKAGHEGAAAAIRTLAKLPTDGN